MVSFSLFSNNNSTKVQVDEKLPLQGYTCFRKNPAFRELRSGLEVFRFYTLHADLGWKSGIECSFYSREQWTYGPT